jgi:hypothetical protein
VIGGHISEDRGPTECGTDGTDRDTEENACYKSGRKKLEE